MVHHHHQKVFFRPYPDEGKPEQRTLCQIKRGRAYPAGLFVRARCPLLSGRPEKSIIGISSLGSASMICSGNPSALA